MYKIQITYDSADSFNNYDGLVDNIGLTWKRKDMAKKALKDIEAHYHDYMILNKEYNAGKKEQDAARKHAKRCDWYNTGSADYMYGIMLKNDDGERVFEDTFWIGYFEHLVDAEIVCPEEKGMRFSV